MCIVRSKSTPLSRHGPPRGQVCAPIGHWGLRLQVMGQGWGFEFGMFGFRLSSTQRDISASASPIPSARPSGLRKSLLGTAITTCVLIPFSAWLLPELQQHGSYPPMNRAHSISNVHADLGVLLPDYSLLFFENLSAPCLAPWYTTTRVLGHAWY